MLRPYLIGGALEAAGDHLVDRGDIVGPLHGFDLEAAIGRWLGLATLEDHHRGHRLLALSIRNVIAFDALRQARQVEQVAQLRERAHGPLLGVEPLHPQLIELLASVVGSQFDHLFLLAPAGHA